MINNQGGGGGGGGVGGALCNDGGTMNLNHTTVSSNLATGGTGADGATSMLGNRRGFGSGVGGFQSDGQAGAPGGMGAFSGGANGYDGDPGADGANTLVYAGGAGGTGNNGGGGGGGGGGGAGAGPFVSPNFGYGGSGGVGGDGGVGGGGGGGGASGVETTFPYSLGGFGGNGGDGGGGGGGGGFGRDSSGVRAEGGGSLLGGGAGGNGGLFDNGSGGAGGGGGGGGGVGAGIYALGGTVNLTHCTITANASTGGAGGNGGQRNINTSAFVNGFPGQPGIGAVGGVNSAGGAAISLRATILSGNTAGTRPDFSGDFTSLGYNLVGDPGATNFAPTDGDVVNELPNVGALADNGGPTRTHKLLPTSLAVNGGDPAFAGATDQRGALRDSAPDIGAYEAEPTTSFFITGPASVRVGEPFDITITARESTGATSPYRGTLQFATSAASSTLPANVTFVAGDAGVKTISGFALGASGPRTITATDTVSAAMGTLNITINKGNTSVATFYKSASPTIYGEPITIVVTVSVTAPASGALGGTVDFIDGTVSFGTAPVINGTATLTTLNVPAAAYTIVPAYSGDANFNGSATTGLAHSIGSAPTTTTVFSTINPGVYGEAVTLQAFVDTSRPSFAVAAGTVTFNDGANTLATLNVKSGNATYVTSALSTGTHSITATFNPDDGLGASTGSLTQEISRAPQTIAFGPLSGKTFGDAPFALTATADAPAPVSFSVTGPATLTGNMLTMTGAGTVTVTASHPGDSNYNPATDVVRAFDVAKAAPTLTWNTPASINEGTALSATQLNATASVLGTFVYSPAAGTVLAAGTTPLTVTFTPTDTDSYLTASTVVALTVNNVAPSILAGPTASPTPLHAGETATFSVAASDLTAGALTIAWDFGDGSNAPGAIATHAFAAAGPYTATVTVTDSLGASTVRTLSLTVLPVDNGGGTGGGKTVPAITWNTPAAVTEGTVLSATQLNATASVPGTFVYSPAAGTVLAAGTTPLTAIFTPADANNYLTASAVVQLDVSNVAPGVVSGPSVAPSQLHAGENQLYFAQVSKSYVAKAKSGSGSVK